MTSITPGSGVIENWFEAGVAWRRVAFEHDLAAEALGCVLDGGGEVEPVFGRVERWQEDVELAVARFDGERGADDGRVPRGRRPGGPGAWAAR